MTHAIRRPLPCRNLSQATLANSPAHIGEQLGRRSACSYEPCPASPGRLHTLADVFAHAAAQGVRLRIDGTGAQVRRRFGVLLI